MALKWILNSTFPHLLSYSSAATGDQRDEKILQQHTTSNNTTTLISQSQSQSQSHTCTTTIVNSLSNNNNNNNNNNKGGGGGSGGGGFQFQMPLHYPRYSKKDYETMEEWKVDMLLQQYGLDHFIAGNTLQEKRTFAMGTFLWPDQLSF